MQSLCLIHSVHTACRGSYGSLGLLLIRNDSLGGEHGGSDGCRVLKSASGNLCRVNDAALQHITVLLAVGIEAVADLARLTDLGDDDGAVKTRILGNLLHGSNKRLGNDLSTGLFVAVKGINDSLNRADNIHALASRRAALAYITVEDVVSKLFNEIAPKYENRQGGYTQIFKLGARRGDAAEMAIVKLIDDAPVVAEAPVEAPKKKASKKKTEEATENN